jgi:hypothetical protein
MVWHPKGHIHEVSQLEVAFQQAFDLIANTWNHKHGAFKGRLTEKTLIDDDCRVFMKSSVLTSAEKQVSQDFYRDFLIFCNKKSAMSGLGKSAAPQQTVPKDCGKD